jgi:hypothetical protein
VRLNCNGHFDAGVHHYINYRPRYIHHENYIRPIYQSIKKDMISTKFPGFDEKKDYHHYIV